MKRDGEIAYVVILHLAPQHESTLPELIQAQTSLPVLQVNQSVRVEANHVYVIPPNRRLTMNDGEIRVIEAERRVGGLASIDLFLRTLAEGYGKDAMAVLLSGAGRDGALGVGAIKEHGGLVVVQDPTEAEHSDMPRNAINTLMVDLVLKVADIPAKLLALRDGERRLQLPEMQTEPDLPEREDNALRDLLSLVRLRTGNDFSQYKHPSVLRRIARRMQVNEVTKLSAYLQVLKERPAEIGALMRDFLISVTSFFRDPETFAYLEREIIPRLFANKQSGDQVRVWSIGSATGEEAYSLAMLLSEHAATLSDPPDLQVFATDIDESAIKKARDCYYPSSITLDVSPERLRSFFHRDGDGYQIHKSLRDMVLFAHHNILRDPPFSRIDLISCRNLLIYLDRQVQQRVLSLLHFVLMPAGCLLLGSSESADMVSDLFTLADKKQRIYFRSSEVKQLPTPVVQRVSSANPGFSSPGYPALASPRLIGELHYEAVEEIAPPSVLISENYEVLHASAHACRYLRLGAGAPALNLLNLVHPALRLELRALLLEARLPSNNESTMVRQVNLETEGRLRTLILRVRQISKPRLNRNLYLVIFDEQAPAAETVTAPSPPSARHDGIVRQIEEELERTREGLRLVVEQNETSTEELRASNEELQAINEELRSATEELETSKEELQSVNEELTTVNQEYREKLDEVSRTNADLRNLMASTDIGTIFLNRDLEIKFYTPRAQQLFNITASDLGRPLDHFTSRLDYAALHADANNVLLTLQSTEHQVRSKEGKWYLARLVPYRTMEDRIDGLVMTFVDITSTREHEQQLREQSKVLDLAHVLMHFGSDDRVVQWNHGCERLYGYTANEAIGRNCHELLQTQFPEPLESIKATLEKDGQWEGELAHTTKAGARVIIASHWILDRGDHGSTILEVNNDITAPRQAEEALRIGDQNKDRFLAMLAHELRNPLAVTLNTFELLARSVPAIASRHERRVIERQVKNLTRLVDDLLDIQRLTHGKLVLTPRPIALAEIIESAMEAVKSDNADGQVITVNLPEEPVVVLADPVRLAQVFSNLIENAMKFTPATGSIEIEAEQVHGQAIRAGS